MPKSESGFKQKKYLQTHQIFSDLNKFSKGHLGSEGVILLVLGMGALEALVIRHCKWMAACVYAEMFNKNLSCFDLSPAYQFCT